MLDPERVEADLANSMDLLWLHLRRFESLADQPLPKEQKERLAKTMNTFAARTIGLGNRAKQVSHLYPRLT
jgi:hypothetical protein